MKKSLVGECPAVGGVYRTIWCAALCACLAASFAAAQTKEVTNTSPGDVVDCLNFVDYYAAHPAYKPVKVIYKRYPMTGSAASILGAMGAMSDDEVSELSMQLQSYYKLPLEEGKSYETVRLFDGSLWGVNELVIVCNYNASKDDGSFTRDGHKFYKETPVEADASSFSARQKRIGYRATTTPPKSVLAVLTSGQERYLLEFSEAYPPVPNTVYPSVSDIGGKICKWVYDPAVEIVSATIFSVNGEKDNAYKSLCKITEPALIKAKAVKYRHSLDYAKDPASGKDEGVSLFDIHPFLELVYVKHPEKADGKDYSHAHIEATSLEYDNWMTFSDEELREGMKYTVAGIE